MKILDLTNKTFGNLKAIEFANEKSSDGSRLWFCICSCGDIGKYPANKLNIGLCTQCYNCGRSNKVNKGPAPVDIAGLRNERLIAVHRTENKHPDGSFLWQCFCDCGSQIQLTSSEFKSKERMSCGCYRREQTSARQTTHGLSDSHTYKSWISMKDRTQNTNHVHYHRYGGRGIGVCERWLNSFENFYADMGSRPSEEHSIDRINNDIGYEPGNCKWSTPTEQQRNRCNTIWLSYNGAVKSIDDWVGILGIHKRDVLYKLKLGYSDDEALRP